MRNLFLVLLLMCSVFNLIAQQNHKTYYLSTNVLSPFAGLNKNSAVANALLPLFSNLEYGVTLSGGYYQNHHSFETRLSYGKSNSYNDIPQIQFGYNLFLLDLLKKNQSGWYIGGFARYWQYHNNYTQTSLNNISSNLTLGYAWKKKNILWDLRLNQPLTLFSFSTVEHTKPSFAMNLSPMPNFLPVLPFIGLNIGYQFKKLRK